MLNTGSIYLLRRTFCSTLCISDWVMDPFGIKASDVDIKLQENPNELQTDEID